MASNILHGDGGNGGSRNSNQRHASNDARINPNGGFTPAGHQSPAAASSPAFDPSVLLNPRANLGSRTPRNPADPRLYNAPTPAFDEPIAFEFSTPTGGFASSAPPTPNASGNVSTTSGSGSASGSATPLNAAANGFPFPQTNGFGSMIERVNNVEQRTAAHNTKRRRVDVDPASRPGSRFGGSSNGIIGQHVRDQRRSASNQSSPSLGRVETVDLTDAGPGNDEDIVEIPPQRDEEVCFGMIQHARLNCHLVPSPKPGQSSFLSPNYWPQVKVVLNRKYGEPNHTIHAYDHTRNTVGTVDAATASGLTGLLDSRLQLRTDCRIPTRQMEPGEKPGGTCSRSYTLDLMLYGPRKSGRTVARHLSQKNIWLRNPPRVDPGKKYENPQLMEGPKPPPAIKERPSVAMSAPQTMRTVEEIRSEVMGVFDSLTKSEDLPETIPDARIQTDLLKHQKQGLHFMLTKEQPRQLTADGKAPDSFWQIRMGPNGQRVYHNVITGQAQREPPPDTFGGILADMMGLGKTLSILSLVVTTLDDSREWAQRAPVQPQVPALPTKNGKGASRFDVPQPQALGLTSLARNGNATLLVCPLSTITNWEEQIKAHCKPGSLRYYIYHGANRLKDVSKLAEYDLVLTTYGSVASEVAARKKGRAGPCPLEEIGWFRVVLDEAHMIREQSTLQFKAICRLQANRRWAVTGTPVQNKLDDLAALLAFLRLKPFDEKGKFTQFIVSPFKVCDPEIVPKLRVLVDSITLRRLKDRIDLPPRSDQLVKLEFSSAERQLYDIFEKNAQDKVQVLAAGREKMIGGKTYIHILQSILRLRLISAHGKELLSDEDMEIVQGMTQDSAIDLDSDDENEEKPALAQSRAYEAFALMQETNSDRCIACQRKIGGTPENGDAESEREEDTIGYMTACFHLLCTTCISTWDEEVGNRGSGTCPVCQSYTRFAYNELRKSEAEVEHDGRKRLAANNSNSNSNKDVDRYGGPHTKTSALVENLLQTKADSAKRPTGEPPIKSVVFSGWTSHLDLIQVALDKAGIGFTRLDGKMSRPSRTAAMDAFRENDSVEVILVSIMAGGLGLNLTSGSNVYVMEPQYNPAAEAQAVDRVHRLGQKRPVRTVRFIMQNSIEEKMLELQEKKMKLASLSMDRGRVIDKAEAAKQKLMDLRSLFK